MGMVRRMGRVGRGRRDDSCELRDRNFERLMLLNLVYQSQQSSRERRGGNS